MLSSTPGVSSLKVIGQSYDFPYDKPDIYALARRGEGVLSDGLRFSLCFVRR